MVKKASVLLAHYNKNPCLPNTLAGYARQQTTFPIEYCFLDDHSEIDPQPVVKKYLPQAKYKRLTETAGTQFSLGKAFEMIDDATDVVVITSCDVFPLQTFALDRLCEAAAEGAPAMPEVSDQVVPGGVYENFDAYCEHALKGWVGSSQWIFLGSKRPLLYLFLGAVHRKDLEAIDFRHNCCDVVVDYKLREHAGAKPQWMDDLKAIHQHHCSVKYPCAILKDCPFYCYRR